MSTRPSARLLKFPLKLNKDIELYLIDDKIKTAKNTGTQKNNFFMTETRYSRPTTAIKSGRNKNV